ncbi:MAG: Folylpolyglutamate synthase [Pseudomonadota bacterium]|jgi:dihydrofolate synthase/folylpolyglutamate synthase
MYNLPWKKENSTAITGERAKNAIRIEKMKECLRFLCNPQNNIKNVIHIAGTNGKGSTCSFLRQILEESGYSVAVYTSPHLIEVNERFYFHKRLATDQEVIEYLNKVNEVGSNFELSIFETEVIMALLMFKEKNTDFNIFEVGMGGEFDATNIFEETNKICSIITSISFDHMEFLGNTIEQIASAKAGIIKKNVPTFLAKQKYAEVYNVIKSKCLEMNSKLQYCNQVNSDLELSLKGEFQKENATNAIQVCKFLLKKGYNKINDNRIKNGLKNAKWPCRLQQVEHIHFTNATTIIDGSHNEDGIRAMSEFLTSTSKDYKMNIGVIAVLENRDVSSFMCNIKAAGFDIIYLYQPRKEGVEFLPKCFQATDKMHNIFKLHNIKTEILNNIDDLHLIIGDIEKTRIVFFGSLYFAGYILKKYTNSKFVL